MKVTKRQADLAALVAEGLANKEIAYRLGLSEGTVKVYLSALFERVGVENRAGLAAWWLRRQAAECHSLICPYCQAVFAA
ncbi:MAG TPA: LuxR C-terminal-related transcriptional regulator [Bryobacteraceae bacterium]|nr:LuxR C-terminal-related transcriptional regulator [Bryobacteraceae bacterium]